MTHSVSVVQVPQRVVVAHESNRVTNVRAPGHVVVRAEVPRIAVVRTTRHVVVQGTGAQGPAGPPGTGGTVTLTAGENISAYHVVRVDPDDLAYLADKDDAPAGESTVGVAKVSALTGEQFDVVLDGLLPTGGGWTVGPLFVGDAGALSSTPPAPGAAYQLTVGTALTTSLLLIRPQLPIYL